MWFEGFLRTNLRAAPSSQPAASLIRPSPLFIDNNPCHCHPPLLSSSIIICHSGKLHQHHFLFQSLLSAQQKQHRPIVLVLCKFGIGLAYILPPLTTQEWQMFFFSTSYVKFSGKCLQKIISYPVSPKQTSSVGSYHHLWRAVGRCHVLHQQEFTYGPYNVQFILYIFMMLQYAAYATVSDSLQP